jgi:hypothetical protein
MIIEEEKVSTARESAEKIMQISHYMWSVGDLEWKLDALQCKISASIDKNPDAPKACILSSRQIGKSHWACVYALEFLIRNPGKLARIIAPTLDQANDIVQDILSKIIIDAPPGFLKRRRSEYRWDFHNGSSLRLGGLKRAHVDSNRGGNASLVLYEECGFVDGEEFLYGVNSVLGPQLLRSQGMEIFISSPSEDPEHPLHTQIFPECEEIGTAHRYTVYDSPSINEKMIQDAIARCGGIDSEAFKREYLAQIIRPQSLVVVPTFDESKHTRSSIVPNVGIFDYTVDWGGVRDLTALIVHYYDELLDVDYVIHEHIWPPNTPTSEIVRGMRLIEDRYPVSTRTIDAPGQLQVDLINDFDFEFKTPIKTDWKASINNLVSRFFCEKIIVSTECPFLIKSLKNGRLNKIKTDFERTSSLGHCDAIAALMYSVRERFKAFNFSDERPRIIMEENRMIFKKPEFELEDAARKMASGKNFRSQRSFFAR